MLKELNFQNDRANGDGKGSSMKYTCP